MEEERRRKEGITLEEEMRLKKERWLVEEQIVDPDAVEQLVAVEGKKGLSNVLLISAEEEIEEEKPKIA
ncbi:hypothetical protein TNCV_4718851 [Trichonephila clavipes]|nr:hypothetical protein TNCV_4718851 [Trichonephila clavipes]